MKTGEATRILVVDDEPAIRYLLTRLFSRPGYATDTAEDGYQAWGLLQKNRYAAVILDLKMPGIGGETLYRRLKSMDEFLARRVIFITGDLIGSESLNFLATSGTSWIAKPFDLEMLLRHLRSLLAEC